MTLFNSFYLAPDKIHAANLIASASGNAAYAGIVKANTATEATANLEITDL